MGNAIYILLAGSLHLNPDNYATIPGLVIASVSVSMALIKTYITLIFFISILQNSDGQFEDYCIADVQTPDEQLVAAMNWACSNGADCRAIQVNQACYLPNTVKDHASYAFNSYYQNMKHKGGSCYFIAAAVLSGVNPSYGSCKFEYLP